MHRRTLVVSPTQQGQRLDRVLCDALPGLGRAAARRLCEAGLVTRFGRPIARGARVGAGDVLELPAEQLTASVSPEPDAALALDVVYQDAFVLVVDKPAGMPCHPLRPAERGTLASALLARYPELAAVGHGPREPGMVHRLDTGTSGLLLVARDALTFEALCALLRRGAIDKRYLALCAGTLAAPALHHAYLRARGPRVTVRPGPFDGAESITTELVSAEPIGRFTLLEVKAPFARRHQVRAHLAALGHPLAGDALYGGPAVEGLEHHGLHASALSFMHPHAGRALSVQAPLPAALRTVIARESTA
jgi:23S rRNA pseudouridine1911/1915/1917 synthase